MPEQIRTVRRLRAVVLAVTVLAATVFAEGTAAASGATSSTFFLWNGGSATWRYNHRVNRLGDFVDGRQCDGRECSARVIRSGASGSGPDTMSATTAVTAVSAPGVRSASGSVTMRLTGARGSILEASGVLSVPEPSPRAGTGRTALLNGYDLLSLGDAAKPGMIEFGLGDPQYDARAGAYAVPVTARLQLFCTSAECLPDQPVDYRLTVYGVVLEGAFQESRAVASQSYSWPDGPSGPIGALIDPDHGPYGPLPAIEPVVTAVVGSGGPAVAGFRSLRLRLDRELHVLAFGAQTGPPGYAEGVASLSTVLTFRNWSPDMIRDGLPGSLGAFGEAGSAEWTAGLSYLTFAAEAAVTTVERTCAIVWPGLNRPADTPEATCSSTVSGN
ncbi:hypothetical protein [Nocardia sp. IFM 10818]